MKRSRKYITLLVAGLLVYAAIRLINDTRTGTRFWLRPWYTTVIEVLGTVGTAGLLFLMSRYCILWFNRRNTQRITAHTIIREFGIMLGLTLLVIHLVAVPLMMFTDDGMSADDYVLALIVPSLFTLLYFAIRRFQYYLVTYTEQQLQLEKMKNTQLVTELKFLKAQYHPHFLFNALNTIYFQMDEDVPAAKKTVEQFSELLRYQLYNQQEKVAVSQELQHLQHFIDIQKIRSSERLRLSVYIDPLLQRQQVYPLLLLPLVENAFKYAGGGYAIHIEAVLSGGTLVFNVSNSLPVPAPAAKAGGIGIENLQRRLELLYPGQHHLTCTNDGDQFTAVLKITL